ncbi:nuclear transport factor 2 family protein [uncultured Dokdonia sp.]|uniref:nuclear transport factor 2 family protein n=1 Tax=uncultured Dokdonia sp. TaxID=575653 RepID=UPI00262E7E71|nr:nuclear transport factor 2 family protein [uncultured Dokdonia sp.]
MKLHVILIAFLSMTTVLLGQEKNTTKKTIEGTLDAWHQAAANADFEAYFALMTDTAIFIGTDATEIWDVKAFKSYSKPHFDKGRAWSFTSINRNIHLDDTSQNTAWFDEHLDTQMGVCRGSGILKKVDDSWKIQHYVLSIAVPNGNVAELTQSKKEWDSLYIKKMRKKD